MEKRNKGVVELALVTVMLLASIGGFLLGTTNVRKWVGLGSNDNKTKQTEITKTESKPIFVKGADGKEYVLQQTVTSMSTSDSSEEQKMSIWQKLMVLPKLWLILMILGIFFPPIAAIMGVLNGKLSGEVKKIVGGVEASLQKLPAEHKTVVLDTLSQKLDSSTKKLVADTKRKLL
jgi:hypothetical protein